MIAMKLEMGEHGARRDDKALARGAEFSFRRLRIWGLTCEAVSIYAH